MNSSKRTRYLQNGAGCVLLILAPLLTSAIGTAVAMSATAAPTALPGWLSAFAFNQRKSARRKAG